MSFSKVLTITLITLNIAALNVIAQYCDCADEAPPSGQTCAEHNARGECSRRWMQRGGYCALTCGFCQCHNEEFDDECASCDDIAPDRDYTCDQQLDFGKCDEPWMKPFCRKTCGRCNCADEEFDPNNVAFVAVGSGRVDKPRDLKPPRVVGTPLAEVLPDDDGACAMTVFEALADAQQFTLLIEIVKAAGAASLLQDKNLSVTIFAPVNEAFGDLAEQFGMTLDVFVRENPEKVMELLQYHVVPKPITNSKEIGDTYSFETLVPGKLLYGSSPVEVDGIGSSATVIQDGVKICKSIVYTVDEVLLPGSTLDEIGPKRVEVPIPQDPVPDCDPNSDVMTALGQESDLSLFIKAIEDSKVKSVLSNEDKEFTIFAPTDEAFTRTLLESGLTYKELLRDKKQLQSIVNYHIVAKDLDSETLKSGKLKTLNGDSILVAVEGSGIEIAGVGSSAIVQDADVDDVCTSTIHKIDSLLLPFDISNEVWAVDGNEAKTMKEEEVRCNSIAHILARNSNLRVLNNAVQAAGLLPLFADKDQSFTLFAPTDSAFYMSFLDPVTQEFPPMLTDPKSLLSIISYHSLSKPIAFSRLRPATKVKTQLGSKKEEDLKLSVVKKRLSPTGKILRGVSGDAAIIQKNIVACNSVIHLIDNVLLPFELEENKGQFPHRDYYSRMKPAA